MLGPGRPAQSAMLKARVLVCRAHRLAEELQEQEQRIELSIRQDERAGAQLAAQLMDEEEAQERYVGGLHHGALNECRQ